MELWGGSAAGADLRSIPPPLPGGPSKKSVLGEGGLHR